MNKQAVKRYLVFVGDYYTPHGCWRGPGSLFMGIGWDDFKGSYATRHAAKKALKRLIKDVDLQWGQIVDTATGQKTSF